MNTSNTIAQVRGGNHIVFKREPSNLASATLDYFKYE